MRALTKLLLVAVITVLYAEDASAQRRRRGSVRYSRPDGTRSRGTSGGGGITSTQTTQWNRRTTQTTATGRRGESATSNRQVTREGDEINVNRQTQTTTGASRETSREIEFDEGRVQEIERESTTTNRFGETIEREREIEREGSGVVSFEGEAQTSRGREVEVEGVAGRGYYGRRGVVANVDTNYRGDWTTVGRRGPYGASVARLPQGYRPYTYYGRSYYYYGSSYYRPYYWGGVPYYWVMPPPYGVYYSSVPVGSVMVVVGGSGYYYSDHVCYKETNKGGEVGYEVVPAPDGLETSSLPPESATITIGDTTFYYYKNTFYRRVLVSGEMGYVVVSMPQGVEAVQALPAEFEIIQAANSYFVYQEIYYLPHVTANGEEFYIVVDAPPAGQPELKAASADYETVQKSLTIPSGTFLAVRLSGDLSSETSQTGQRFTGFLDADLKVGEILAAPRGTKIWGKVAEAEKAGSMSGTAKLTVTLTDIEVSGGAIPVFTTPYGMEGRSEGKDTARKEGGAAILGAMIGAIADGGEGAAIGAAVGAGAGTVASAATKGQQVVISAQTVLQFTLQQPLALPISVRVTRADDGA